MTSRSRVRVLAVCGFVVASGELFYLQVCATKQCSLGSEQTHHHTRAMSMVSGVCLRATEMEISASRWATWL